MNLCIFLASVSSRTTRSRCWPPLTLSPSTPRTSSMSSTNRGSRWWRTRAHTSPPLSWADHRDSVGKWGDPKTPGVKMGRWSWQISHQRRKQLRCGGESSDVKSCVNRAGAPSCSLTLPHCDFATRTETKNTKTLNQGSGSLALRGLESQPGGEGRTVTLESAPDQHGKRRPSEAIATWSDRVWICQRSAWAWTSARSHVGALVPPCDTLGSARIPPHHRTSRPALVVSAPLSAGTPLSRKTVCSGATLPSLLPFLLGILACLPFVSLSFYL